MSPVEEILARIRAAESGRNAAITDSDVAVLAVAPVEVVADALNTLKALGVRIQPLQARIRIVQNAQRAEAKRREEERSRADTPASWRDGFIVERSKDGPERPADVPFNGALVVQFHAEWAGVVAFDKFAQEVVKTGPCPWRANEAPAENEPGTWADGDSIRLEGWIYREEGIRLGRDAIDAAIIVASERAVIDPPRQYLEGLRWDGAPRVGGPDVGPSWLSTYLGVPDSDYARQVGRWSLISAAARTFQPGCKVDNSLVFEGEQRAGKSSAVKILFSEAWFSDTEIDLSSKDRFGQIQGVWGYELAEFDSYSRQEASQIKAFASSATDKYRPPYMRRDQRIKRRCVFIATINPGREYLQDETGGTRWWPVKTGVDHGIDLDALKRDRDALWSEAVQLYRAGERWYPATPEEHALCRPEQEDRGPHDAWEHSIERWITNQTPSAEPRKIYLGQVLGEVIGLERGRWGRAEQIRAGACLRALGYMRRRDSTGSRDYYYVRGTRSREPGEEG